MPQELGRGHLAKMVAELQRPVSYALPLGESLYPMNGLIGTVIKLQFTGSIRCCHCGRETKKSFNQGYCYPCFKKLPQCDQCIVSPEKCHYAQGTCRDPQWGERFCMTDHIVYLANSSGLKVGITRASQVPTRWIDQGATQALPILRVKTRQQSGLVEMAFKDHVADRTNWRAMLKGNAEPLDLVAEKNRLLERVSTELGALSERFGLEQIQSLPECQVTEIHYPVGEYPSKISSHNFDKTPVVEGCLQGIKGQYLIFDTGVINIRKFGSYQVILSQ